MLPKIFRTIFLALGLAMVWLGFFYQYELKKQPVIVQEFEEESFYGGLEVYTLADDNYSESDEALSGLELMPLHVTDFSVSISPDESLSPDIEQQQEQIEEESAAIPAETAVEVNELQAEQPMQEAGIGRFPLVLAAAGAFFLFCGVLSCRLNNEL